MTGLPNLKRTSVRGFSVSTATGIRSQPPRSDIASMSLQLGVFSVVDEPLSGGR